MSADLILSSLSSLDLRADGFSLEVFAGLAYPPLSSPLQKLQDMDERRVTRLGAGFGLLSEAELQVVPIIGKCLEGMKVAAESVDAKNVGAQHEPRGDEVWAKGGWLLKMCLKLAAGCHSLSLPKGLTGPHRITQVRVCPPR